jgi:hypothetical protein
LPSVARFVWSAPRNIREFAKFVQKALDIVLSASLECSAMLAQIHAFVDDDALSAAMTREDDK